MQAQAQERQNADMLQQVYNPRDWCCLVGLQHS